MTTPQSESVEDVKQEILTDLKTRCWENAEQVDAYFDTALDRIAEAERTRIRKYLQSRGVFINL